MGIWCPLNLWFGNEIKKRKLKGDDKWGEKGIKGSGAARKEGNL